MATIEAETINEVALITRDEAAHVAQSGNYEPVRFNAMKHGILSRLAVLAHEDHAEFADLLAALLDEHRPAGITERDLIEELAATIWRKRGYCTAIKAQTLGEGGQALRLEKLNRYETHLDRKFERTLAMLLKLKELRGR